MLRYQIFIATLILLSSIACIGTGSCERFNIDSFEMTTGINIPRVSEVECYSDDSLRVSVFYLDTTNSRFQERYTNMLGYAKHYDMKRSPVSATLPLRAAHLIGTPLNISDDELFSVEGTTKKGRYWKYLVLEKDKILITEMRVN